MVYAITYINGICHNLYQWYTPKLISMEYTITYVNGIYHNLYR